MAKGVWPKRADCWAPGDGKMGEMAGEQARDIGQKGPKNRMVILARATQGAEQYQTIGILKRKRGVGHGA